MDENEIKNEEVFEILPKEFIESVRNFANLINELDASFTKLKEQINNF